MQVYIYNMGLTDDGIEINGVVDEQEIEARDLDSAIELAEAAFAHHTDIGTDALAVLKDINGQIIWKKRSNSRDRSSS